MIQIASLTKRFGPILAVDSVTFNVQPGEVLGFLGPNGAGKSTTMKMITGFLTPTSGSVLVRGRNVQDDPIAAKEILGYLPEGAPAYPDMTPLGFLTFIARLRGYVGKERGERIDRAVALAELGGVVHQPIDTLSKGFRRRVGLAQAILHDPDVLIMDEPTDGLDPNQKHHVRALIREMAARGGKAIVLSTHILEEVEAVCTRTLVIARGRIVFDGTPSQLAARSPSHNAVTLRWRQAPGGADGLQELRSLPGVRAVDRVDAPEGWISARVSPTPGTVIVPEVSRLARERRWEVDELHVDRGRLDEVFRDLTAKAGPGPAGQGGSR